MLIWQTEITWELGVLSQILEHFWLQFAILFPHDEGSWAET